MTWYEETSELHFYQLLGPSWQSLESAYVVSPVTHYRMFACIMRCMHGHLRPGEQISAEDQNFACSFRCSKFHVILHVDKALNTPQSCSYNGGQTPPIVHPLIPVLSMMERCMFCTSYIQCCILLLLFRGVVL